MGFVMRLRMALEHHPRRDQGTCGGARAASLIVALCGMMLLSACAAFTEHVSNHADGATGLRVSAITDANEVIVPERYVSAGMRYAAAGSIYYGERKGSRADRAAAQPHADTKRGAFMRTSDVVRAPSQLAHAKTISGDISNTVPAPDGHGTMSRVSPAAPAVDVESIVFNMPTSMTLDRRTLIQLALATTGEVRTDAITPAAADAARHTGQYIEARLSGGDFVIEPVTAGTQALQTARATEWLWLVTPKKPGKQHLQLTVTALTDTDAGSAPLRRVLPTFEHTILVSTRWQDDLRGRVETNAAWLWAALLAVPLLLFALYVRRRRRQRRWFRGGDL
jgi:hypothetical protein